MKLIWLTLGFFLIIDNCVTVLSSTSEYQTTDSIWDLTENFWFAGPCFKQFLLVSNKFLSDDIQIFYFKYNSFSEESHTWMWSGNGPAVTNKNSLCGLVQNLLKNKTSRLQMVFVWELRAASHSSRWKYIYSYTIS